MVKHIKIADETKKDLDLLKHPGQSYDGIVREIIAKYKIKKQKASAQ